MEKGKDPPSCPVLPLRGEALQSCDHLVLSVSRYFCLIAEAVIGSGDHRSCGSLTLGLERPSAASFANSSTASFPLTLL